MTGTTAVAAAATAATRPLRIASFLPAATEMLYSLGLGDLVCGITHECDYPPEVCVVFRFVSFSLLLFLSIIIAQNNTPAHPFFIPPPYLKTRRQSKNLL